MERDAYFKRQIKRERNLRPYNLWFAVGGLRLGLKTLVVFFFAHGGKFLRAAGGGYGLAACWQCIGGRHMAACRAVYGGRWRGVSAGGKLQNVIVRLRSQWLCNDWAGEFSTRSFAR